MPVIDAKLLNTGFNNLQNDLAELNRLPSEHRNISFNFDLVNLVGPALTGQTLISNGYDGENHEQIFRIYDDVQVVGVVLDVWGLDRPGLWGNGVNRNSRALSFNIKILGNFTDLDDELGYPSTFKSTEFNLVKDIKISFADDKACLGYAVPTPPPPSFVMRRDYLSNQEYDRLDTSAVAVPNQKARMPSRLLYYPLDKEEVTTMLHGGAEYILTIGVDGPEGKPEVDVNGIPAYHMLTSMQVTLVCRCFRRRFE